MGDESDLTVNYSTLSDRFYKRLDYLGNLIQVINGAFLTIFIAFFTASFSFNGDVKILIASISILFFWRYYIHLVDFEIIDVYGRIVYCEAKIGINDDNISLEGSLSRQQKNQRYSNRGQLTFDLFAMVIMIALFLNSLLNINEKFPIPYQGLFVAIAAIEIAFFIVYVLYITKESKIQMLKISKNFS
jgi:hypothetical protein